MSNYPRDYCIWFQRKDGTRVIIGNITSTTDRQALNMAHQLFGKTPNITVEGKILNNEKKINTKTNSTNSMVAER